MSKHEKRQDQNERLTAALVSAFDAAGETGEWEDVAKIVTRQKSTIARQEQQNVEQRVLIDVLARGGLPLDERCDSHSVTAGGHHRCVLPIGHTGLHEKPGVGGLAWNTPAGFSDCDPDRCYDCTPRADDVAHAASFAEARESAAGVVRTVVERCERLSDRANMSPAEDLAMRYLQCNSDVMVTKIRALTTTVPGQPGAEEIAEEPEPYTHYDICLKCSGNVMRRPPPPPGPPSPPRATCEGTRRYLTVYGRRERCFGCRDCKVCPHCPTDQTDTPSTCRECGGSREVVLMRKHVMVHDPLNPSGEIKGPCPACAGGDD